jgi:hypothetical protein
MYENNRQDYDIDKHGRFTQFISLGLNSITEIWPITARVSM